MATRAQTIVVVPFKVKELVLDCTNVEEQVVYCSDVRLQVIIYFLVRSKERTEC